MNRPIIHRCGHVRHHHVAGYFVVDQDRDAARLSRKPCADCMATAKPGGATADGPELPALSGSPRQVAWAESIRRRQLTRLRRLDPDQATLAAGIVDASWWIDHRIADLRMIASA